MLRNYITIALRLLRRHRAYTAINLFGLAVGMACCLLILLYVRHERSYDRFHEHADRIVRVGYQFQEGTQVFATARTPHPLAPALQEAFPEVEAAVRFRRAEAVVRRGTDLFKEERFYFADASAFRVFSLPLLAGDPATVLAAPFSLVLSQARARAYFGDTDPVGRMLRVEGLGDFTVAGVMQDSPPNTQLAFDVLASYATLAALQPDAIQQWDNAVTSTYLLLTNGYDAAHLETRLSAFVQQHAGPEGAGNRLLVAPLTDLHLYAGLPGELGESGDARSLTLFSGVALFILFIAALNFVSLTTARAAERGREVGLRKVLGAARRQLIRQFLGESVLLALLAMAGAAMLVDIALPAFNALTGKALVFAPGAGTWAGLLGAALGVGVLAGGYPALALSAYRPTEALKGLATPRTAGARVRKGLVVVQFGLAVLLIVGTLVMADQLAYLQHKDLGFDKGQVVVLPMQEASVRARYETLKDDLRAYPGVAGVAASYHTPGQGLGTYFVHVEGQDEDLPVPTYIVDYDYIETMGLRVVAGRAFSEAFPTDAPQAFMINETAARQFGWEDPLGKTITWDGEKQGRVIGVLEDFHVQSLHTPIEPMVVHIDPGYFRRLSVRIRPGDVPATLAFLQATMQRFDPDHPFEYSFVDQDFAARYEAEQRAGRLFGYATVLAILIACLGLLGLASFATRQRTREIGVRKVLGASVPSLVLLLSADFARPVAVAVLLAAPVAYLAMERWLGGFAYHVDLSWQPFLMAGLGALGIALLTVGYQAVKAARADPVKSLRYE